MYNSVGVKKKTNCSICEFFKLIIGKKLGKKEKTKTQSICTFVRSKEKTLTELFKLKCNKVLNTV